MTDLEITRPPRSTYAERRRTPEQQAAFALKNVEIDESTGCWVWRGPRQRSGYGIFHVKKKHVLAHRAAYEQAKGKIPAGLHIDHLCRNRLCVNPSHLEAVTRKENILRGIGFSAINARKEYCPKGHPYSGNNLYLWRGRRFCRTCSVAGTRKWRRRYG